MTLTGTDLGAVSDLAEALGLVDSGGTFQDSWLSNPGDHLATVLSDDAQRGALLRFVDEALGGGEQSTDAAGLVWLPIVESRKPKLTLYAVIDQQPNYVGIGVGATFVSDSEPSASVTAHVPVFQANRGSSSVTTPILLGQPGGRVSVSAEITVDTEPAVPGEAHLGSVTVGLRVPTATNDGNPEISIELRQLQLPGATAPSDLVLSLDSLDDLQDSAIELILGLVKAQADALTDGPLEALARMLGLRAGSGIPEFPVQQLADQGVDALATWFEGVVADDTSRGAWLEALADLAGEEALVDDGQLRVELDPDAVLRLGLSVTPGASGQPILTPTVSLSVAPSDDIRLRAEADLFTLDLGTGSATALPRLSVQLVAGRREASTDPEPGGTDLLTTDPTCRAMRLGFALDPQRRPTVVLAADGVDIGEHHYDTLDLTNPDALTEIAGDALEVIAGDIFDQLGGVVDAVRTLVGLSPPAGFPTLEPVSIAQLLQNPLEAVRVYWDGLVRDHADAVPATLQPLRDLISAASESTVDVSGDGLPESPWTVPLVGPVSLEVYRDGDLLQVAVAASYVVDTLGQGCTAVTSSVRIGLIAVDLANRHAEFCAKVEARLFATAAGKDYARFQIGDVDVRAEHVGLSASWQPAGGLAVDVLTPNLSVAIADDPNATRVPLTLPVIAADASVSLPPEGWDSVEALAALLARSSDVAWIGQLVDALGWTFDQTPAAQHLRLADLVSDPIAAIRAWLTALVMDGRDGLILALDPIARVLGGSPTSFGAVLGSGRPDDPYLVGLGDDLPAVPQLAVWLLPDGPSRVPSAAGPVLRAWRPGNPGLDAGTLRQALDDEATMATEIADLVSGRPDIAAGLEALAVRWLGTDGRIVAPTGDVPEVSIHRVDDVSTAGLADSLDLETVLGHAPADTVAHIVVARPSADLSAIRPDIPAERRVDLRAAGLDPAAFAIPAGAGTATGDWLVVLGGPADCVLATGDPDGVTGQATRLRRFLDAFEPAELTVVASAEAGHAVLKALADQRAPTAAHVVTLGTAWSPVAFTIIDDQPAADALRLLHWLLPGVDEDEPDDPDLALARGLVDGLYAMTSDDDPGRELRPPASGVATPTGVEVHAMFGVAGGEAISRAVTAVVAAGLSTRAQSRTAAVTEAPSGARGGVRLQLPATGTGITVGGHLTLELVGADLAEDGVGIDFTQATVLRARLEIRRDGGWLVGGPDPGRSPGPRAGHDVRWVSADVVVPISGDAPASAKLVLHEASVFGLERERWVVSADQAAAVVAGLPDTIADAVTPVLPEVRALLSDIASELAAAANEAESTAVAALVRMLITLDVFAPEGGAVPDGTDHLLFDPAEHVAAAIADTARRTELDAAITILLSNLLAAEGGSGVDFDLDLEARSIALRLDGSPGDVGMLPWSLQAELSATAAPVVTVTVGSPGLTPAGGAELSLSYAEQTGLGASLDWHRAGVAPPVHVGLWPEPDIDALLRGLAVLMPSEIGRLGLDYLRGLDPSVTPIVDAALDAIGLLGAADVDGARKVLSPAGLITDPVGWFSHPDAFGGSGAFDASKVVAFLEAMKPILGIPDDADDLNAHGRWKLSDDVYISASSRDGQLALTVDVDSGGLEPIPTAAGRLSLQVTAGLLIPLGAAPVPTIDIAVGLDDESQGVPGTRALHVSLDGGALRVFVRPGTGADIALYPDPPGLGSLAANAELALPYILKALADLAPETDFRGDVGRAVAAVGDLLALRDNGNFSGERLTAWAQDPVASLRAALLAPSDAALEAVQDALNPLLDAMGSVEVDLEARALSITVGGVSLSWLPNPLAITIAAEADLPGVEHARVSITLNDAGVQALAAEIGPAAIDAGGTTLRPFIGVVVGNAPAGGRRIELGLAAGIEVDATSVAARWYLDGLGADAFALVDELDRTAPERVAAALIGLLVDLVAGFVLTTDAVVDALGKDVGSSTVRDVLTGPVLDADDETQLDQGLFDLDGLLDRLFALAANLAAAQPSVRIQEVLRIGLTGAGGRAGVTIGVDGRAKLGGDDVVIWLEADTRWVQRPDGETPAEGLSLFLLDTSGPKPEVDTGLEIGGLGLRVGREDAPLLDMAVTLGSVAVHGYGHIGAGDSGAGIQVQLSDLAVGIGGAGNGSNQVAEGIVKDAGTGSNKLAPSFSPALAVQKHGSGPVLVSLSAGDPPGPWWLSIQKGFGPVYIEQVGFGVTVEQQQLQRISLLLDGRVSIFGLTAAVDDLQLFYSVTGGGSFADPSSWGVDVAGFTFGADIAGLTLEGGLRKFTEGANVEFVGMLVGRFAAYGLSVYGGYGTGVGPDGQTYSSFFAFGAVNGPIGGPPAFFLTGIGGGLGINRALKIPTDLSRFGDFVFIKALDPGAKPSGDPMDQLVQVRNAFPMQQGELWFAAGISFTCFSLVDGIAVISVAVGDGLEVALLGLARVALPRPQVALVSIELGLVVRFSTKEGVLWIQAQLTDNSWLLDESVRLTGGFAFVTWYKGQYAGQFVLTMGGYHPSFHRDGYPEVPRLGFRWSLGSSICIKGENYFALTSEAMMVGGRLEASAEFGAAWAHIVFGADGIVYFDPFRFELDVYARISAGVTIDVWIGEITISISIGADLHLEGPKFHGRAKFSVGPVGITVPFGDADQNQKVFLEWSQFVAKYLEEAPGGQARAISAITGRGTRAPGATGGTQENTADGSAGNPFVVYAEFEVVVTTTVPTATLVVGPTQIGHGGAVIGVAPMNVPNANSRLILSLVDPVGLPGVEQIGRLGLAASTGGGFPAGVWGPPQPDDDRKIPSGDVIRAIDGATLSATASLQNTLATPVNYFQVETGDRKPLPFVSEREQRAQFISDAAQLHDIVTAVPDGEELATAKQWMSDAGMGNLAAAAFISDRASPPMLGSLSEGFLTELADQVSTGVVTETPPAPPDRSVHPPTAIGVLMAELAAPSMPGRQTTVSQAPDIVRATPPDLGSIRALTDLAVPLQLVRQSVSAAPEGKTAVAVNAMPLTRAARGSVGQVSGRLAAGDSLDRLAGMTKALGAGDAGRPEPTAEASAGATVLRPGEIAVLQLPNAGFDTDADAPRPSLAFDGGPGRLVALTHGGDVLADAAGSAKGNSVGIGTERLVALGGAPTEGVAGWHAGQQLAYVGWSSAVVPGATVHAEGAVVTRTRDRFRTGWVPGAELVDGAALVTTRFDAPVTAVAILVDDPLGTDAARGLVFGLEGADRPTDADGTPRPPSVVAFGNRSALVYAIVPSVANRIPPPIRVQVASQPGWHLAGVLGLVGGEPGAAGADAAVGELVQRLTTHGLDGVVRPLVAATDPDPAMRTGPSGLTTLRWIPADQRELDDLDRPRSHQP